ncbi:hypothetical protein ACQCT3_02540 [Sutcliffiella horikoshii]|uniref:hypothetical protein n=1 Tax=Sutcliffiella horikoshii TaxID=79883 RepID=UPI003CF2981F
MIIKNYKESKFLKYDYQAIYQNMLQPVSPKEYSCFDEFSSDFELYIDMIMREVGLDYFPHPEKYPYFQLEYENFPVFIPENADESGKEIPFILGSISNMYPIKHNIKPSGFIFDDFSYLQIDITLAHSLNDRKIYLLFHSFHYGRMRNSKEVYFFRYDKESDHEIKSDGEIISLDYKPIHHFHGNSDDPHFEDREISWEEKITKVINIIRINLPRLLDKYKECDDIQKVF